MVEVLDLQPVRSLPARTLAECEDAIERGAAEIWTALGEIRDQRLYLETHSTFETTARSGGDSPTGTRTARFKPPR